ncbi:MAG TPA: helix-turn-helix transcriptional regulator [Usitatibacter sp.]|nr:helix-turn-helix transcriptional regulator [Usitatibacter sp.]
MIATLKRLLKRRGMSYRELARQLDVSEPTVKRLFSRGGFSLDRVVRIASVIGISLAELAQQAEQSAARIRTLTDAQERELVSDQALLLVAACALNGWTIEEIIGTYRFSRAECLRKLLKLDRLGLITLLPGDRIRLNVERDFDWIPGGPIQTFFRKQEKDHFLASDFESPGETLFFLFGMLSPHAKQRLDAQLRKLRDEFAELHRESLGVAFEQRSGACLLIAQRDWEPKAFAALRRPKR